MVSPYSNGCLLIGRRSVSVRRFVRDHLESLRRPTLGAAIILATQGENLMYATVVMNLFGVGAAITLIALGMLSKQALQHYKSKLFATGILGKKLLGALILLLGLFVVTGIDKVFEAWILTNAPEWLSNLTVSI